jgi:hypothetical protein
VSHLRALRGRCGECNAFHRRVAKTRSNPRSLRASAVQSRFHPRSSTQLMGVIPAGAGIQLIFAKSGCPTRFPETRHKRGRNAFVHKPAHHAASMTDSSSRI